MDEISESAQQTRNKFNKAGTLKDDDDMVALFQLTPGDLKALEASDNKVNCLNVTWSHLHRITIQAIVRESWIYNF